MTKDADTPRRELLAIQKRLWRRLKREISSTIEGDPPNIAIYREEYERDLRTYRETSSKRALVEAAAAADIVFVGDYHTLVHAQKTVVKLLLALTKLGRSIVNFGRRSISDRLESVAGTAPTWSPRVRRTPARATPRAPCRV